MHSEMKLIVYQNDKIIGQVIKETNPEPAQLLKSLKQFQLLVNATITKMIENSGVSADEADDQLEEDSDDADDEDDRTQCSPKRMKEI